jgi:glycosyltransferase involved in cell wall biosynthesis
MMNVYGSVAAKLTGIPMIGTLHGKLYFTEKRSRIMAYKLAISLCSCLIAVSKDLRNYMIENLKLKRDDKILTIYNGIDIDKYRIEAYPNDLAEEFNIRPGTAVVGTVGSLFEVKGFEYLLKALQIMKESGSDILLLIAGTGRLERELKAVADELGIAESVRFLGFRGDIPRLLNLVDVYICSSVSEGLSLSILEAMACGRPIIATDVGGNPELITEGVNGFLVPSRDPSALAERTIELLNDKELRSRLGTAGRQAAEEKFSLETMMQNYYELYGKLLG